MRKFCAIFLALVMGCHDHEFEEDLTTDEELYGVEIGWQECIPLCPTEACPIWDVCVGYTVNGVPLTQGWDIGLGVVLWCYGEECAGLATTIINKCGVCL